jgi:hypothetical protein
MILLEVWSSSGSYSSSLYVSSSSDQASYLL